MNIRMNEWEGALVRRSLMLRDRDMTKGRLTEADSSGWSMSDVIRACLGLIDRYSSLRSNKSHRCFPLSLKPL